MSYNNLNWDYRRAKVVGPSQLKSASDIFHPTSDQKYMLGCVLELDDGRRFRYCKDGGSGITKARLVQAIAPLTTLNDEAQTGYAKSVGDNPFDCLVTTGSSISDHDLIDGIMYCNSGDAIGDMYIIKDNKWTTGDTVLNIEVADTGGIRTAMAVTDTLTFIKNPYRDVLVQPTSPTNLVVGVTVATVTASYYFWAQTRGPCTCIIDASDNPSIGQSVGVPGTHGTAGGIGVLATTSIGQVCGHLLTDEPAGDVGLVMLCIE